MIIENIAKYLSFKGISVGSCEREIGVSNGTLSKPISKKTNIKTNTLENFLSHYPDINPLWLLTNKGDMLQSKTPTSVSNTFKLRTDYNVDQQQIPLYSIEATAGLVPLFENPNQIETEEFISIPRIPKCDGALFVTGDSMYPLLKSGDIVAYQKVFDKQNSIFWGEMYLVSVDVDREEYVTVKYIQKSDKGEEYVKLVSENKHHQPKDVHLDKIRALAMVKASVRINSM